MIPGLISSLRLLFFQHSKHNEYTRNVLFLYSKEGMLRLVRTGLCLDEYIKQKKSGQSGRMIFKFDKTLAVSRTNTFIKKTAYQRNARNL